MRTKSMRLRVLGIITTLAAIGALAYLSLPVHVAEAGAGGGTLSLDILVDLTTFNPSPAVTQDPDLPLPVGPFHIHGELYAAGAGSCNPEVEPIGTYDCWGFIPGSPVRPPGFISQEYHLFGRGKIQVQGREGPGNTIAVVGGTGEFRNVRGEGTFGQRFDCPDSPTFTLPINFNLIGAPN